MGRSIPADLPTYPPTHLPTYLPTYPIPPTPLFRLAQLRILGEVRPILHVLYDLAFVGAKVGQALAVMLGSHHRDHVDQRVEVARVHLPVEKRRHARLGLDEVAHLARQ